MTGGGLPLAVSLVGGPWNKACFGFASGPPVWDMDSERVESGSGSGVRFGETGWRVG